MFLEGLYREDLPMKYICCSIQGLNTQYTLRRIQTTQTNIHLTHMLQSSYLSRISQIIFMQKKLSCGQFWAFHVWQLWGNWKFLHTLRNFGIIWEILGNLATIYALSCGEKIEPKSTFVEQKWQIWGLIVWIGDSKGPKQHMFVTAFHINKRGFPPLTLN